MSKTPLALLILFFFSGACSLVYQVVWVRMLMPVFGVSTFAVSIVLAAFMAGLALGSYWCGRVADRRGNGLRLYALLELGIGVFALIFPLLLAGLDEVYTALYGSLQGIDGAFVLVRLVLAFALLLVPTTLMGATLPTLSKAVAHRLERVGGDMGRLYAANTLGAAAGCAVAAFFALEYLGVSGTTYAAAAGNLIIALVAYRWSRDGQQEQTDVERDAAPTTLEGWLVLGGFALSGFVALGYEVLWTRLLAMLLQSATAQTLSTILVAFLLGLAGGGRARGALDRSLAHAAGCLWRGGTAHRAVRPKLDCRLWQHTLYRRGVGRCALVGRPSVQAVRRRVRRDAPGDAADGVALSHCGQGVHPAH